MTETNDLKELSQRYLDLWEENLSHMADDREVAETMARTIELMNSATAAFASMAQSAAQSAMSNSATRPKDSERPKNDTRDDDTRPGDSPTRTPSAFAAHGNTDHDLDDFAHRLASLEQRITNLESAYRKSRRGTGKGTRRS